ncbi:hypothetical protein NMYAN_130041 [Nitrosomonas nitrosa]|uniref:Uncharacterized protein n=1 Tax=Nitrosomonas nitrosa TaxID=52442 RepID=A0A8H8YZT1_9PROT|nr:hypothetical protein NMYAN_130041 [Nitrosomonas nitrosa]
MLNQGARDIQAKFVTRHLIHIGSVIGNTACPIKNPSTNEYIAEFVFTL